MRNPDFFAKTGLGHTCTSASLPRQAQDTHTRTDKSVAAARKEECLQNGAVSSCRVTTAAALATEILRRLVATAHTAMVPSRLQTPVRFMPHVLDIVFSNHLPSFVQNSISTRHRTASFRVNWDREHLLNLLHVRMVFSMPYRPVFPTVQIGMLASTVSCAILLHCYTW